MVYIYYSGLVPDIINMPQKRKGNDKTDIMLLYISDNGIGILSGTSRISFWKHFHSEFMLFLRR